MGTVIPPWITKKDFYRTPFNFCDRWCEYCHLTSICKIYKEGQKDRKRAIKEGKDPDSVEFAFEMVHKNLKKTFQLLHKNAKKWGIDLKKIEEEVKDEDWDKEPNYHNDFLYKTAEKINKKLYKLLNKLEFNSLETDVDKLKKEAEIISWYNSLFIAKIARALSSFEEEKKLPEDLKSYDDKTSAFIAFQSLEKISEALMHLSREKGILIPKKIFVKLSFLSLSLADLLEERFGLNKGEKYFSN